MEKISGIYQITNIITNKKYIGSSKHLLKRKKDHFSLLRRNIHHSSYFQYAYNKYGKDNFIFEILFLCSIEHLIFYEQLFLNHYEKKELYNTCLIAGNTMGIKHSEKANKEKSIRQRGVIISDKTKEKIRRSLLGKKHTMERRKNLSKAHLNKNMGWDHPGSKPVIQINKDTNEFIKLWSCGFEAERFLRNQGIKIRSINIGKVCHNCYGRKTAGGYKWKFANIEEILKYKERT